MLIWHYLILSFKQVPSLSAVHQHRDTEYTTYTNAPFPTTVPAQLATNKRGTTWFGSRLVVFPSKLVPLQRRRVDRARMHETCSDVLISAKQKQTALHTGAPRPTACSWTLILPCSINWTLMLVFKDGENGSPSEIATPLRVNAL